MSPLQRLRKKLKQVSILITREELRSVLDATVLACPEGARHKVGEVISPVSDGTSPGKLKVYGVKAGGYGFVYIVLEEETLTPFCLKTFRDRYFEESEKVRRFTQEAETWIRLGKHPHIVYAHSVLNIGGRPYLLLEYVAGSDLSCRIRNGPLPVKAALKYAIQLCRGMIHAQSKLAGFVHGDLKPTNCLITIDDTLKLTDFGQATIPAELSPRIPISEKSLSASTDELHTPVNNWGVGTPPYMAPEQFDATRKPDGRSDIYSFGVTLFEMLTGTRPFGGKKHEECFLQHRSAVVPDPHALNANLPVLLGNLVLWCMKKSPSERPANFGIIEQELSSLLRNIYQEEVPRVSPAGLTEAERINRGVSLAALDHYDDALACFDRVLAGNPRSARAWAHKATTLSASQRYDEALVCFDQALALNPQLAFAWAGAGEGLTRLGRHEEALESFDRALVLDPKLAPVWSKKGRALTKLGKLAEALVCANRALELDPQAPESYYHLGLSLQALGRYDEATAAYEKAIALQPLFAEAHFNLGKAQESLRRCHSAIESFRQALKLKPGYREARARLRAAYRAFYTTSSEVAGEAYTEKLIDFLLGDEQQPEVVVRASMEFLRASKFDPAVLYLCGYRIYQATGHLKRKQSEELIRDLSTARENIYAAARDRHAYYWLGKIYYGLDLYDQCREVFRQSMKLFGPDDKALYYLAACHEIGGDTEAALNHYRQALGFDPGCALTRDGIRRMESKLAQPALA